MDRFHEIERVSVTARPTGVCRLGGVRHGPTSRPETDAEQMHMMMTRCGSMFLHLRLYNQLYIVHCAQLIVPKS